MIIIGLPDICNRRSILRMRDAGVAAGCNFGADGNCSAWKRYDQELLSEVRRVLGHSRFSILGRSLESNVWRDGCREYW